MRFGYTWAVPDLHGRFDLFTRAIASIRHAGGGNVVFLGDYVDRGPQSRQIIEALIEGPDGDDMDWLCLKGNHEDMMVGALSERRFGQMRDWTNNGGGETLDSYPQDEKGVHVVPQIHIEWMAALPLFHETEHRIFCHSGGEPDEPLSTQTEQDLLWSRCERLYDYTIDGKHVVHGHTPYADGPIRLSGRTNLDTGAYATGRLVLAFFNELTPGPPQRFIEITDKD